MNFTMTRTLIAIGLIGAYVGWSVGQSIPLLPNWVAALGAGITLTYLTTSKSEYGDLLRYIGACAVDSVLLFRNIDREVMLTRRSTILAGRLFVILAALDQKYQVCEESFVCFVSVSD